MKNLDHRLLQKGAHLIQCHHLPNLLPDGFWRMKVNSHHCRSLGEQLPCHASQRAHHQVCPASASAASPASSAPCASAPSASARPADVTPSWHRQDANSPATAREPSATAEECADRWYEDVIKHSHFSCGCRMHKPRSFGCLILSCFLPGRRVELRNVGQLSTGFHCYTL